MLWGGKEGGGERYHMTERQKSTWWERGKGYLWSDRGRDRGLKVGRKVHVYLGREVDCTLFFCPIFFFSPSRFHSRLWIFTLSFDIISQMWVRTSEECLKKAEENMLLPIKVRTWFLFLLQTFSEKLRIWKHSSFNCIVFYFLLHIFLFVSKEMVLALSMIPPSNYFSIFDSGMVPKLSLITIDHRSTLTWNEMKSQVIIIIPLAFHQASRQSMRVPVRVNQLLKWWREKIFLVVINFCSRLCNSFRRLPHLLPHLFLHEHFPGWRDVCECRYFLRELPRGQSLACALSWLWFRVGFLREEHWSSRGKIQGELHFFFHANITFWLCWGIFFFELGSTLGSRTHQLFFSFFPWIIIFKSIFVLFESRLSR